MSGLDWASVLAPFAPPVVVVAATPESVRAAVDELESARPNTIVRTIDAADCSTTPAFLRALRDALEFPDGPVNWNVVNERLYDMTWFPEADGYVVVIVNCEQFASASSADDLSTLDRILSGIVEEYRDAGRELDPRVLVCQCAPAHLDDFAQVLQRLELTWPAAPMC
jgi:hypothetical protein